MEIKLDSTYKGTHILVGNDKRHLINKMIDVLRIEEFLEIQIPIIQLQETFRDKVGEENQNIMFKFKDRGDRDVCLAPEYTAVIQQLANTYFKLTKDVKLFYVQECFRGEKPQAGRYRQFTQLGVEILNPSKDYSEELQLLAKELVSIKTDNMILSTDVVRGLDYYKNGKGFQVECEELGAQKQICGGGEYQGGIGFAIGIDRLLLLNK